MYLVDTNVLIWAINTPERIPKALREILSDPEIDVWVSAVSIWEISIKAARGKLSIHEDLNEVVERIGFRKLYINFEHAHLAGALPRHHDDPFDRMLVAQSILEQLKLITSDSALKSYDFPAIYI